MTSLQVALQQGLAALKQKNYPIAIAHLEACQSVSDPAVQTKAQAALVKAYAQAGQVSRAIALCQSLTANANPQAQAWAVHMLGELSRRYPAAFTHASAAETADKTVTETGDETADETGFTPFASVAPAPSDRHIVPSIVPSIVSSSVLLNPSMPSEDAVSPALQSPAQSLAQASAPAQPTQSDLPDSDSFANPLLFNWRYAGRSQKWSSLGAIDRSTLWALTAGTAIALIWMLSVLPVAVQGSLYWINFQIALLTPFKQAAYWLSPPGGPWGLIALGLIALFVASPWLLDALLRQFHMLRPFGLNSLESFSPEAVRLLKRTCHQRRQSLPTLHLLPTAAPIALTYGYLPNNTRIVVSQGLLDRLEEDEIAAIYAAELGHVSNWSFSVLSWLTLVAQLPYLLYWQMAAWGDRQSDRVLQTVAVVLSCLGYGLYWLCRLPGLGLSRLRLYFSDRTAAELTGNPNALTRALLKLAIGTAYTVQRWEHTSSLLESFELLAPVGHRSATTLGSLFAQDLTDSLEWDRHNPYRRWLSLLEAHPPLGNRLHLLTLYAQHWKLEPELEEQGNLRSSRSQSSSRRKFLLQAAPYLGLLLGGVLALCLWLLGGVATWANWLELTWFWGDRSILFGAALIGFSIGTFVRINAFFPDVKRSNLLIEPALVDLLVSPTALPVDSQPVRLQGKLLGRRGFANRLHQDLLLQTSSGLIRLHYGSSWGSLGDLLSQSSRPSALMDQPVTVTGWFRRGAIGWIDVETIQGRSILLKANHPVYSTLAASIAALLGVFIIFQGGS